MTKEGSLLYLRNQVKKLEEQLHKVERQRQESDLSDRVHAAGQIVMLKRRQTIVARKLARLEADTDGLWTSLKDEIVVDLDAISAAFEHMTRPH